MDGFHAQRCGATCRSGIAIGYPVAQICRAVEAGFGDGGFTGFERGHFSGAVGGIKGFAFDDDGFLIDGDFARTWRDDGSDNRQQGEKSFPRTRGAHGITIAEGRKGKQASKGEGTIPPWHARQRVAKSGRKKEATCPS